MANLKFADIVKVRDQIDAQQRKDISNRYKQWAGEIGERADWYKRKTTASSPVSEKQMRELKRFLTNTSFEVGKDTKGLITNNMMLVSDSVCKTTASWLATLGYDEKKINIAFSTVPKDTVNSLITGKVYEFGWSLSQRIWGVSQQNYKDIYSIMAKGIAENKGIYDIAKEMEAYVKPGAKLPWNGTMKDGTKIYKRPVDYNAQRLARTLSQHAYQQSIIAVNKNDPFCHGIKWHANGPRACELCMSRDGNIYKLDDLPLDHPNGMCEMEPVLDDYKSIGDQLADWYNSPDGTYPELDEYAKDFGYAPTAGMFDKAKQQMEEK